MGSYLDEAIERLKEFEGSVPWMYLDTVGKVTVGVGSMLLDARAAGVLPFLIGERAATPEEIEKEFARVSALARGKTAAFYRKTGGLRLSDEAIDAKLRDVLEGFEGYLKAHIGRYDVLPEAAKLALLDMVYNLGPGKLFHGYPKLIAAVEKGDWPAAAGASLRRGPSAARNTWTRTQFLNAARQIAINAEAAVERISWWWIPVLTAAAIALLLAVKLPANSRGRRILETGEA